MYTTEHYLPGAVIEVTPTMETLGDQPYRCRVYPDECKGDYFQGLMVEASSREAAVRAAAREFNTLYPHARQIEIED